MSIPFQSFLILLAVLGYLVSPFSLFCGWVRFARREWPHREVLPLLTLVSFVLATASAVLAVGAAIYARFHYFPYYDPLLMKIFGIGLLLSLGGLLLALIGIWRPSSLRWYAPVSAITTAVFWLLAALGE